MNAGRELDRLVAEKVMGWTELRTELIEVRGHPPAIPCLVGNPPDGSSPKPLIRHVPQFSTDIAAAWQVVEKLDILLFRVQREKCSGGVLWEVICYDRVECGEVAAQASTAPHAICLAALLACGVELPPEVTT